VSRRELGDTRRDVWVRWVREWEVARGTTPVIVPNNRWPVFLATVLQGWEAHRLPMA
jgi:hypothetical protein